MARKKKQTGDNAARAYVSAEDLPRRTLQEALRVADLLRRNYATGATWDDIAKGLGVSAKAAPNKYPLWSAVAYGVVAKEAGGAFVLTETGRKILAPNYSGEDQEGKAKAILTPKILSRFYTDHNGHLVPDPAHFPNVLENKYGVPRDRVPEAMKLLNENGEFAKVFEQTAEGRKVRLEGIVSTPEPPASETPLSAQQPMAGTPSHEWEKKCFYITPIGDEGTEVRKHADMMMRHVLEPVAAEFGLEVVRADKITKSGLINQQVFEHLAHAKLCVADLSFSNPNVFYELGVRHTCKLRAIQLIRGGDKIPFDVAQGRTIKVDTSDIYLIVDRLESAKKELREHVKHLLAAKDGEPSDDNPLHVYLPNLKVSVS